MSNCRCISVNSQFESEFSSNLIYPQAILIEDINQDNKNELIIGTSSGEILIYKGSLGTPWLKNSKQIGCITCMAYDSITDSKVKYLIVHDVLGYVYFFGINQVSSVWTRKRHASALSTSTKSQPNNNNNNNNDFKQELTIIYQTKLLINPKSLIIDDLNNNGTKKMVVAYTDRLIRVYSWLSGNNQQLNSKSSSSTLSSYAFQEVGKFVLEQSWELLDQIGSIGVFRDRSNAKMLVATQSGGRLVACKPSAIMESSHSSAATGGGAHSNSSSASSLTDLIQNSLIFSPRQQQPKPANSLMDECVNFFAELNLLEIDRAAIPTYLVTNVTYNKSDQYAFLITMNGDVFFFRMNLAAVGPPGPIKTPIWHSNINALVLKYYKVDINKDGNEELLIATPEGQLFVINCSGKFMCFDLGEPIKMFHLGHYSTEVLVALATTTETNTLVVSGSNASATSAAAVLQGPTTTTAASGATSSEADLNRQQQQQQQQCNQSAFELALDASPISPPAGRTHAHSGGGGGSGEDTNVLCFVYVSSITNRICLLQADTIIAYSRLKSFTQLKYRCENIFTKRKSLSYKLYQALESQGKSFDSKMIHDILYAD